MTGPEAQTRVSKNVRRLWTAHAEATGESQPVTAARMFPWLSNPADAARLLRRIMGPVDAPEQGSWMSSRVAAGIASGLDVNLRELYS